MDTSFYTHTLLASIVLYMAACVFYFWRTIIPKEGSKWRAARTVLTLGLLVHTANWVWRWVYSGQPPYVYLDEMTVFLVWCMVAGYLFFEYTTGYKFAGGIVAILAVLGNGYASSVGTPVPQPLIPALQSYWLQIHVMSYTVGYGFALVGYVIALLYLSHEQGKNCVPGRLVLAVSIGMVAAVSLHVLMKSFGPGSTKGFNWLFAALLCGVIYAGVEFLFR